MRSNDPGQPAKLVQRSPPRTLFVVLIAVTVALVFVTTFSFQVYIPATKGYFNFGDIMIFIVSLTFGPLVGGIAGGLGSSLSDAFSSSPQYAPFTLVIKGLEGFIAGLISQRSISRRVGIAWSFASLEMIGGYFVAESLVLTGYPASLACVPVDILQVVAGGIVGIPASEALKRTLPSAFLKLNSKASKSGNS